MEEVKKNKVKRVRSRNWWEGWAKIYSRPQLLHGGVYPRDAADTARHQIEYSSWYTTVNACMYMYVLGELDARTSYTGSADRP